MRSHPKFWENPGTRHEPVVSRPMLEADAEFCH
jgi:hypothetical protein